MKRTNQLIFSNLWNRNIFFKGFICLLVLCFSIRDAEASYIKNPSKIHLIVVIESVDKKIGTDQDLLTIKKIADKISNSTSLLVNWHLFEILDQVVEDSIWDGEIDPKRPKGKEIKFRKYNGIDFLSERERRKKKNYTLGYRKLDELLKGNIVNFGPDDVVWFYYSGHGFGWNNREAPIFKIDGKLYSFENVHSTLRANDPRLLITMYDSCACDPEKRSKNVKIPPFNKGINNRFNELFVQAEGEIEIKASDPNQCDKAGFAYGNKKNGGLFTVIFYNYLIQKDEDYQTDNLWDEILRETKDKVMSYFNNENQIPYYFVEVIYSR